MNRKASLFSTVILTILIVLVNISTYGQQREEQNQIKKPEPTFTDLSYGKHERHVLDFWQAQSESPTPVCQATFSLEG